MKGSIFKALLFNGLILLPFSTLAEMLPQLPEYLSKPYHHVKKQEQMKTPQQLQSFFKKHQYSIETTITEQSLPEFYTANLPTGLNKLEVHEKTTLFIQILLPSVIRVNNDILSVRDEILRLQKKRAKNVPFTAEEDKWLSTIQEEYKADTASISELLERVDIVPADLVLAQGIDESGWGTSHFAVEGNALYGQHYSPSSGGTYLTTHGGHVKVASFDNLYHSTASYVHNLNTTSAYEKLRAIRAEKRETHGKLTGEQMVTALLHYSTRGQQYVDDLMSIMKHHKLYQLNNLVFNTEIPPVLIQFEN